MPTRSATRRIDSAAGPSASSSSSAASTISAARPWRASATQEPLARAERVADGAVEADVEAPGERGYEPAGAERRDEYDRRQHRRADETVQRVVERHGAGVQLAPLEAPAGAGQQGQVGCDGEHGELPPAGAGVVCDGDGGEQQGSRAERVGTAAERAGKVEGGGHRDPFRRDVT